MTATWKFASELTVHDIHRNNARRPIYCAQAYAFADKAEVDIEKLSTPDFLARLDHASGHRWGLVIELVIEALIRCRSHDRTEIHVNDFVEVFATRTGIARNFSPFTIPDFREIFDSAKLLALSD